MSEVFENDKEYCIFCKIISGEIPSHKIYEDADTYAFLDAKPVNPGHTLVIPKEHYPNLYGVPDEILKKFISVLKKVAIAVKRGVNADGINIHNNNDSASGQDVYHLHFHVIPRHNGDGYKPWHGKPYKEGEAESVAQKIIGRIE